MDDCIFCKIASGAIPAEKVYEDAHVAAFRDIKPVAPEHILVISKKHVETVHDLSDVETAGTLLIGAGKAARVVGLDKTGYRLVINNGRDAHQEVKHVHIHMIGGRDLRWPPG
jgi:histidine triad (HIT) family protein